MKADQQTIRELAYRLWEERGKWDGGAVDDWLAAERQLAGQDGDQAASSEDAIKLFPADDSIASAVPNKPAANVQVQLDEVNAAYANKARAAKSDGAAAPGARKPSQKKARGAKD